MRTLRHWMRYQFKWQLKSMLIWSVILGAISLLVGWAFQPFSQSGYFELVKNLPDYMKKAMLGNAGLSTDLESFLSLEYFSWMGLMFAFYPFINGTGAIAGEIESNTLEPLMSKPISRSAFYWGKYLVMASYVLGFVLINFSCLWFGLRIIREGLKLTEWLQSFALMGGSTIFFLSLAFFFSAIFNQSRMAMTWAIGFGIFQYLFNMIVNAVGKGNWGKWTVFHHADAAVIFTEQRFPLNSSLYILLLAIIFGISGWLIFVRRDIST